MAVSKSSKSLAKYQEKRDFTQSPEPTGKTTRRRADKSLFFCVQKHLASHLHYDFRLEHQGVLLSWAVPKGPSLNPRDKRLAMHVEDHPFDYGDFEGVIPSGYGAGIVMLWDKGIWKPEPGFEDISAALDKGELKFRLEGVKLKGSWVLVHTHGRSGDERSWLLIKHRDEWAGEIDVAEAAPKSVKSFGDFADILARDKPDIWQSHRPAEGGDAGAMFKEIINEAVKRKLGKSGAKVPEATKTPKPTNDANGKTTRRKSRPKAKRRGKPK